MRSSLLVRDLPPAFSFPAVALLFLVAGCSKPSADKDTGGGTGQVAAAPTPVPPVPDTEHQPCFGCNGTGLGPCREGGCNNGQLECPGTCLRLNRGAWQHMNVAGHSPNDVWQKFPNGPGQWTYWNQNHVGDVIVIKDGRAINTGKCTTWPGHRAADLRFLRGQEDRPRRLDSERQSRLRPPARSDSPQRWPRTPRSSGHASRDEVHHQDSRRQNGRGSSRRHSA